jgi:hypothetical protein
MTDALGDEALNTLLTVFELVEYNAAAMYTAAGEIMRNGDPRSDQVRYALMIRRMFRQMAATLNNVVQPEPPRPPDAESD